MITILLALNPIQEHICWFVKLDSIWSCAKRASVTLRRLWISNAGCHLLTESTVAEEKDVGEALSVALCTGEG